MPATGSAGERVASLRPRTHPIHRADQELETPRIVGGGGAEAGD